MARHGPTVYTARCGPQPQIRNEALLLTFGRNMIMDKELSQNGMSNRDIPNWRAAFLSKKAVFDDPDIFVRCLESSLVCRRLFKE